MLRCIDLAKWGAMYTSPNPQVGSVIVYRGKIIGEGFHSKVGGPHAEVEAIRSVADPDLLKESTLYVNLEPCSHHGRTPPCADLIVENKIPRVVVANEDPNPSVSGKGLEHLRASSVDVMTGVCAQEAEAINRPFFHQQLVGRPYYKAKWARTSDGFMGRQEGSEKSSHISSDLANRWVHQLRAESDAILVGSGTANADDPLLTTRLVDGPDPVRVVLDPNGELRSDLRMFKDGGANIVVSNVDKEEGNTLFVDANENIYDVLDRVLMERDLVKILVEGGAHTLRELERAGRMDEALEIIAPMTWGNGLKAPKVAGKPTRNYEFGPDRANQYLKPVLE